MVAHYSEFRAYAPRMEILALHSFVVRDPDRQQVRQVRRSGEP